MHILGISAFYHNSAAALITDGRITAAAQEERFTRKKHDPGFPVNAVKYCLKEAGITIDDLEAIVFYDKPLLKFERLLETYYGFAPKGLPSFLMSIPVWLREKMFLKRLIRDELNNCGEYSRKNLKMLFPEHHLSHAASAFYPSNFKEAAILTIDGVGEWATASICHGKDEKITILKELHFPHSIGLLYSSFTYFTGFKVNSGEYKLMGLAPYGNKNSGSVNKMVSIIRNELMELKEDGSVWLNQEYFNYATGLRMVHDDKWEKLFGFPRRESETPLEQHHCDLALAIQEVTEEAVIRMAHEAKRLTDADKLCMAGGVALNCVANGKLMNTGIFKNIFIQPAAGDAGGSLGAALAAYHLFYQRPRVYEDGIDMMQGSYLGPEFSESDVKNMARKYRAVFEWYNDFDQLAAKTASLLADGNVIGWMQGRMEFGPRALGNRSILGDPRNPEMQKKMNLKIKYRENFRPFAPSVLAEEADRYFKLDSPSPYMLLVQDVREERRNKLPENYNSLPLTEKLYFLRSDLPSITHIDFSARIQTVHKQTNERFWKLIDAFRKETGYAVIVNTSFNVRGEPIVCTPEDAYKCLMRTEMDYLIIGNCLFDKTKQPEWKETSKWKEEFVLD